MKKENNKTALILASVMMFSGLSLLIGGIMGACKESEKPVNVQHCNADSQVNVL